VRQTSKGDAVYALVLNIRGKILSDLWALDRGDGFSLVVPLDTRDALLAHLEQYIIMEDVVIAARENASRARRT
jgi:folate-binding Fe-S cluster repair protein YgfZ